MSVDGQTLRKQIAALVQTYSGQQNITPVFIPGETPIPPSGKIIDAAEMALMMEAVLDGWLTTGRFNEQFQQQLAAFLGVQHVLSVNSGSSANLVAWSTLTSDQLGERAVHSGDEVICVAASFPTTINPIMQFGAIPVFVDVEIPTYNINPGYLEAALTTKTKAVVLAHTLGNPFNLSVVRQFCSEHGLWLIEDCCDALGSLYQGSHVGTFGDLGTLSFYPAHHITMGEGGAVFTNNAQLSRIAESFRDWGRDCYCPPGKDNTCGRRFCWKFAELPEGYDHKYTYSHAGYNLKITDIQAACGLAQLQKLPGFIERRQQNFDTLTQMLAQLQEVLVLPQPTEDSLPSWFGYPITLTETAQIKRLDLLRYLDQKKIGSRLLFAGNIIRQPYMRGRTYRVASTLEQTDRIMRDTFWVGVYPALTEEHLNYVAISISEALGMGF